jgi:hypothetical protein
MKMAPLEAPPIEVPPALIATVALVSVAGIALIVGKMISLQRERKSQGIPVEFSRRLNVTSVALLMVLLGVLAPYGILFETWKDQVTLAVYFHLNLTSFLWSYVSEVDILQVYLLSWQGLAWSLTLLAFYLVYPYELIEYCQGQTSFAKTVVAWLVSQLPILVMLIPMHILGPYGSGYYYDGPTFITLVAGLIIMRIAHPRAKGKPW